MSEHESIPCPICHGGQMQLKLVTFTQVYNQTLVSAPNTPAWECDFCRTIKYDAQAISRIDALVGQAGPPPNRHRRHAEEPMRARYRSLATRG